MNKLKPGILLQVFSVLVSLSLLISMTSGRVFGSQQAVQAEGQEQVDVTSADPSTFPDVVARINDVQISRGELVSRVEAVRGQMGLPGGKLPLEIYRSVLKDMIGVELLYQESWATNVAATPEEIESEFQSLKGRFPSEEAFLAQLKEESLTTEELKQELLRDLSVQKYVEGKVASRVLVSDNAKQQFYLDNLDKMQQPEQLRLSHILVKAEAGATEEERIQARAEIESLRLRVVDEGADFAELANQYSDDPGSRGRGGEMIIRHGQTVDPFERAAFGLEPGEVSDVVETRFGFHIIKLSERMPSRQIPFTEAEPRIQQYLRQQGLREEIRSEVDVLRSKAQTEVFI